MKSPAGADRGEVERMNEEKDKTVVRCRASMLATECSSGAADLHIHLLYNRENHIPL